MSLNWFNYRVICYRIMVQNIFKGVEMKTKDYFNPATYMVVDRVTGEEINIAIFIEQASVNGWQKAYAKTVAEYIKCGGGSCVELLAYILVKKDNTNLLHGTQREIAVSAKVSLAVVSRTIKALTDKKLIKKVRSGCYMVSPKIMANGGHNVGAMMFRLWGEI